MYNSAQYNVTYDLYYSFLFLSKILMILWYSRKLLNKSLCEIIMLLRDELEKVIKLRKNDT